MSNISTNPNMHVLSGNSFNINNQKINEYRGKWQHNPVNNIVERYPIHLDIESTSRCNLSCNFCASKYEKYSLGDISFNIFKKIIDEGSQKGLYSIKLNYRGEPLLNSKISKLIKYAKEKDIIDIFFNTNATLLDKEKVEELIDSGLDRLIVSFEGYTKETYESNRVGASFNIVVDNIKTFTEIKKKLNLEKPVLRLQTVAIRDEKDYFKKYIQYWEKYADEITSIDLRDEMADYSKLNSTGWSCPYPWLRLTITWDGNIQLCPFADHGISRTLWKGLGNINKNTIEEIWHSKKINEIRDAHIAEASHEIIPCKSCSYRGTEILKKAT